MTDQQTIYREALDTAIEVHFATATEAAHQLAALYAARGVAALRNQFPDAAYVWIDVDDSDGDRPTVEICRLLAADGAVLWDADAEVVTDPGPDQPAVVSLATASDAEVLAFALGMSSADDGAEASRTPSNVEIESPATDAFAEASERQHGWYVHPWRDVPETFGDPPATMSGQDPALVSFADVDKRAAAVLAAIAGTSRIAKLLSSTDLDTALIALAIVTSECTEENRLTGEQQRVVDKVAAIIEAIDQANEI